MCAESVDMNFVWPQSCPKSSSKSCPPNVPHMAPHICAQIQAASTQKLRPKAPPKIRARSAQNLCPKILPTRWPAQGLPRVPREGCQLEAHNLEIFDVQVEFLLGGSWRPWAAWGYFFGPLVGPPTTDPLKSATRGFGKKIDQFLT